MASSAAAHAALACANPLDAEAWQRLIARAARDLPRGGRGVDIGCGPGSLSRALATLRPDLDLLGVDRDPDFMARAARAGLPPGLRLLCGDAPSAAAAETRQAALDLLLCVGASQAFGTPAEALAACHALLKPGAHLLWADIEWAAEPPPDFLDFLGCPRALYWPCADADATLRRAGFEPLARESASAAAWQAYEDSVRAGRLAHAEATGDADLRLQAQAWHAAFEDQGRHCFAFVAHWLRRT